MHEASFLLGAENNCGYMNKLKIYVSFLLVACLIACHQQVVYPEDAPRAAMDTALAALQAGDYDTYLSYVDYGEELDSIQLQNMKDVLRRHEEWKQAERERVVSAQVVDIQMQGDTVCTAYYQYVFADSCRETVAQKMVRRNGQWKVRIRN